MKKIIRTGILFCAIALAFSSCKKAIESLTMLGTWQVDNYSVNGIDQTAVFNAQWQNYKIQFDIAHNYYETATVLGVPVNNSGPWTINSSGTDMTLTNHSDSTMRYFHIIEIKVNSAKFSESNGTKVYSVHKI